MQVDKPVAVIRPATVRKEWANPARNPDPKYLADAARELRKHFYVVSLADLEEGEECWWENIQRLISICIKASCR